MCVIAVCKKRKPTKDELDRMESANPDGGGMVWYEDNRTCWSKGLNHKEINRKIAEVKLPFVVHFRIATVGGKQATLTHPFLIKDGSPLILKGETTSIPLLFHNGHVNSWEELVLKMSGDRMIPNGEWSDTRAIAWLMSIKGHNLLKFLPSSNKFVVCYPNKQIRTLGTWEHNNGVYTSNNYWKNPVVGFGFHNDYLAYDNAKFIHPEMKTIQNEIERYKAQEKTGYVKESIDDIENYGYMGG